MTIRGRTWAVAALLGILHAAGAIAQNAPTPAGNAASARQLPPASRRTPTPEGAAGVVYGIDGGTAAPDGIGVTVKRAVTAGEYNVDELTYVPWEDASVIRPLLAGSSIPDDSVVRSAAGEPYSLNQAVRRQPTVLIFYRGGWCPYCNAHLRDLQASEPELKKLGYQILAISTDTPEEIRKFNADRHLTYALLSDATLDVAARFGIRYKVSQTYLDHVRDLDLKAKNGGYLLTPGVFIFDRRGVIRFAYANNNYAVRASQEKLLQAAREALRQ
jgi:peroxiredoxin